MNEDLKVGEVYEVTESCGMFLYKGKYLGIAQRKKGVYTEDVLVFENIQGKGHGPRFFSANWATNSPISIGQKPYIYLRSNYGGDSIENLNKTTPFELKKN
jgi:hypothetical protein